MSCNPLHDPRLVQQRFLEEEQRLHAEALARAEAAEARVKELEQENERLHLRSTTGFCGTCWSKSWAPCPEDAPGAVPDPSTQGWMFCELCQLEERYRAAQAALARANAALEQIANGETWQLGPDAKENIMRHGFESIALARRTLAFDAGTEQGDEG